MAKPRKRHVQQELFKQRGGKRSNAGRKPTGRRAGSPHKKRPTLKRRFPVHVVLRVHEEIGSLRKRLMYAALRAATIAVAKRELENNERGAFRIVHISIQRDHIHLLVEADHKRALSNGMQRFQISAAKRLNRAVSVDRTERRRGNVFTDRYHEEIITSPSQARRALAYVLNNWRKHREDETWLAREWKIDAFSTASQFTGWIEAERFTWGAAYEPLVVYAPRTWLLQEGWMKGGGLISCAHVPSERIIRRTA